MVAAVHVLEAEAVVGVGAHGQHEALPAQQRQERHEVRPVDAILTTTTTAAQRRASPTAVQAGPSPPVLLYVVSPWEESHLVELVWGPVGRGHHDDATRPQLAEETHHDDRVGHVGHLHHRGAQRKGRGRGSLRCQSMQRARGTRGDPLSPQKVYV